MTQILIATLGVAIMYILKLRHDSSSEIDALRKQVASLKKRLARDAR